MSNNKITEIKNLLIAKAAIPIVLIICAITVWVYMEVRYSDVYYHDFTKEAINYRNDTKAYGILGFLAVVSSSILYLIIECIAFFKTIQSNLKLPLLTNLAKTLIISVTILVITLAVWNTVRAKQQIITVSEAPLELREIMGENADPNQEIVAWDNTNPHAFERYRVLEITLAATAIIYIINYLHTFYFINKLSKCTTS